jgi:hypothetical protein
MPDLGEAPAGLPSHCLALLIPASDQRRAGSAARNAYAQRRCMRWIRPRPPCTAANARSHWGCRSIVGHVLPNRSFQTAQIGAAHRPSQRASICPHVQRPLRELRLRKLSERRAVGQNNAHDRAAGRTRVSPTLGRSQTTTMRNVDAFRDAQVVRSKQNSIGAGSSGCDHPSARESSGTCARNAAHVPIDQDRPQCPRRTARSSPWAAD